MTIDDHKKRRTVLKGATVIAGSAITGMVSARNNGGRGPDRDPPDPGDLCWEGKGTDAIDGLGGGTLGHFVLTAGGRGHDVESAGLKNETTGEKIEGEETGGSTFHFRDVEGPLDPGEICLDEDEFEGTLGRNAQIVLSEYAAAGYQVDLIYGDPIERFDPDGDDGDDDDGTYTGENRLLQAYWSKGGLEDHHLEDNSEEYSHCLEGDLTITEDISVTDGTATACIDPGDECDVSDFALVAYSAPNNKWDSEELPDILTEQRIYDQDLEGDEDGCFSVTVPPLESNT